VIAEEDRFAVFHRDYVHGSRNQEGEILPEFSEAMSVIVANTWIQKKDLQKIMNESGGCKTTS